MVAVFAVAAYAMMTALAFGLTAAICPEDMAEQSQSGNWFSDAAKFLTFQSCSELPSWLGFVMFAIFVVPWGFLIFFLLGPIFSNSIAGSLLLVGLLLTGIGVLIAALV